MNIALPVCAHEAGVAQQSTAVATLCSAVTVRCGSAETHRRRRRYIADLMVEDRKKKYGMHVCSSEKAMPPTCLE